MPNGSVFVFRRAPRPQPSAPPSSAVGTRARMSDPPTHALSRCRSPRCSCSLRKTRPATFAAPPCRRRRRPPSFWGAWWGWLCVCVCVCPQTGRAFASRCTTREGNRKKNEFNLEPTSTLSSTKKTHPSPPCSLCWAGPPHLLASRLASCRLPQRREYVCDCVALHAQTRVCRQHADSRSPPSAPTQRRHLCRLCVWHTQSRGETRVWEDRAAAEATHTRKTA